MRREALDFPSDHELARLLSAAIDARWQLRTALQEAKPESRIEFDSTETWVVGSIIVVFVGVLALVIVVLLELGYMIAFIGIPIALVAGGGFVAFMKLAGIAHQRELAAYKDMVERAHIEDERIARAIEVAVELTSVRWPLNGYFPPL